MLVVFCVVLGALLGGCASCRYLWQAGLGQLELSNKARPVAEVVADERTPPGLGGLLSRIPDIKKFGEKHGLRATKNYEHYVQLDRKAAVWVVSASQRLRFEPETWSFPFVGSFTYLGWFDRADADKHAAALEARGLDVYVRAAPAYSTLGWFRDPVLSTMFSGGGDGPAAAGELANTVLHESVHATVYINDQSYFNESLASFVADALTPVYLAGKYGQRSPEYEFWKKHVDNREKREERRKLMHAAYTDLAAVYNGTAPDAGKLERKNTIISKLARDLGSEAGKINNAVVIQFKTYGSGTKNFEALLASCGGSWQRFISVVGSLTSKSFSSTQQEDFSEVLTSLCR